MPGCTLICRSDIWGFKFTIANTTRTRGFPLDYHYTTTLSYHIKSSPFNPGNHNIRMLTSVRKTHTIQLCCDTTIITTTLSKNHYDINNLISCVIHTYEIIRKWKNQQKVFLHVYTRELVKYLRALQG